MIHSEWPENKTLKPASTFTIAILIFLHFPFRLLRDLHQTDSVVLLTKHFGPQSICFSFVSPGAPCLISALFCFQVKEEPRLRGSRPVLAPTGNCCTWAWLSLDLMESTDSNGNALPSYRYMYLPSCCLETSLPGWEWIEVCRQEQPIVTYPQMNLIQYS